MKLKLFVFLLLLSFYTVGCNEPKKLVSGLSHYTMNSPNYKLELPPILHEISGLTIIDDKTIACVQDEKGIVFIYDLVANSIVKQLVFGEDGDYEDIAKVGETFYILRSDGAIIEFADYNSSTPKTTIYETNIPAKDNEGLHYDNLNNRLLIGTKSKIEKNQKGIYSFDLATKKLAAKPVFTFDTELLDKQVKAKGIAINNKKGALKFKISAIAFHPKDRNLYVLSSNEYLIFVFDSDGGLIEVAELDPTLYPQAEGIAFYENGDMLISNEGAEGKPNILKLVYR